MKSFKVWIEEQMSESKCVRCGATGAGNAKSKYTSFSKVDGKVYCDACARQVRREENK